MLFKNNGQHVSLSHDHKPDNEEEKKRIYASGGEVFTYLNKCGKPVGPARVWVKSQNYPGLAMSRAMGDQVGSLVGVISVPEVIHYVMDEDSFIVIASDGIWEFMTEKDVNTVVQPYYEIDDAEGAAEALVKEAFSQWKHNEVIIDDITCIVLFIDYKD